LGVIKVPRTETLLEAGDATGGLVLLEETVSLKSVVNGLNALGVSPREIIDILKSIKAAGALHAEFIVQ